MHPKFSVIIPLYNKRPYIYRAVDSVLTQSFNDFELIVVDDGSTDGSVETLANIRNHRLKIIQQENMGGAGGQARNTGMAAASGEWFAFLDGDDMWLPDHLQELEKLTNEFPKGGLISTGFIEAQEGNLIPNNQKQPPPHRHIIDYLDEASKKIGIINCSTTAIRKEVFQEIGGFSNFPSGPDLEYWVRIALKYPIAISNQVTSIYFRGNQGNMEQLAKQKKPQKIISSAKEISPSIAFICNLLDKEPDYRKNSSVQNYYNSRVYASIYGALYRGDVRQAQLFTSFYKKPINKKQKTINLVLHMPAFFINNLLRLYNSLRILNL